MWQPARATCSVRRRRSRSHVVALRIHSAPPDFVRSDDGEDRVVAGEVRLLLLLSPPRTGSTVLANALAQRCQIDALLTEPAAPYHCRGGRARRAVRGDHAEQPADVAIGDLGTASTSFSDEPPERRGKHVAPCETGVEKDRRRQSPITPTGRTSRAASGNTEMK